MYRFLISLFTIFPFFCGCNHKKPNVPIIKKAIPQDFGEMSEVSSVLADGLTLDLCAPGPLLFNAVAITFDNKGAAYVSETTRRKSSDFDIRAHRDWMIEDDLVDDVPIAVKMAMVFISIHYSVPHR